jgi:hypothetical protein
MTDEPRLRRCAGCQARYRPGTGPDPYCSAICAGNAAMRSILTGLRRFAQADTETR